MTGRRRAAPRLVEAAARMDPTTTPLPVPGRGAHRPTVSRWSLLGRVALVALIVAALAAYVLPVLAAWPG